MDDTFGDFTSSEDPASMQGLSGGAGAQAEVDPEADFLAREQAAFAAIALNDALPAATSTVTSPAVTSPSTTQDILFGTWPLPLIWTWVVEALTFCRCAATTDSLSDIDAQSHLGPTSLDLQLLGTG